MPEAFVTKNTEASDKDIFGCAREMLGTMDPHKRKFAVCILENLRADYDTKCEAMLGLAARGDIRVKKHIEDALNASSIGSLVLEAAEVFGSRDLLPALEALKQAHRDTWDETDRWHQDLDRALEACFKADRK